MRFLARPGNRTRDREGKARLTSSPADRDPGDAVSPAAFRDAMAHIAAAVHVITTDGAAGLAGTTATAVCAVSDTPATLLVCLNRSGSSNSVVRANGVLAVNTLRAEDEETSAMFAGRRGISLEQRFAAVAATRGVTGAPILPRSLLTFDCRIDTVAEVGTHTVLFCRVVEVVIREPGPGLIYVRRIYTTTA